MSLSLGLLQESCGSKTVQSGIVQVGGDSAFEAGGGVCLDNVGWELVPFTDSSWEEGEQPVLLSLVCKPYELLAV